MLPLVTAAKNRARMASMSWSWVAVVMRLELHEGTAARAPRLRGLVDAAASALPVLVANDELLELAGGGARKRCYEVDRCGALEVGEMLAGEFDELVLGRCHALAQNDQRLRGLAPLLAGHADHGALQHGGVLVERVFDLRRADVF